MCPDFDVVLHGVADTNAAHSHHVLRKAARCRCEGADKFSVGAQPILEVVDDAEIHTLSIDLDPRDLEEAKVSESHIRLPIEILKDALNHLRLGWFSGRRGGRERKAKTGRRGSGSFNRDWRKCKLKRSIRQEGRQGVLRSCRRQGLWFRRICLSGGAARKKQGNPKK